MAGNTTTTNTLPLYSTGASASTSVTPTTGSQFPSQPVATGVPTREAGGIPKALAVSPVTIDNGGQPVTVQQAWDSFNTMSTTQRKAIQQQMFGGGLLTKQSDVSGNVNPTSLSKWKSIVEESATSGNSVQAHLDILGNSQVYNQIGTDLQKQSTSLQTAISAPKSLSIPLTNDAVLRAYVQASFAQALGHSPTEQQLQTFVSTFHQQEVSSGMTQLSEPRQYDQQQLSRDQGELSQLKALGPNGLDSFVQAYKTVMSGSGLPGANTPQGADVNGAIPPASTINGAPTQEPILPSAAHGGVFGLSPQTWIDAAKAANIDVKRYPTPSSAPESIQTAVFSHLADGQYQKLGNWADVASVVAGGKPGDTTSPAFASGNPVTSASFGNKVATEVNGQLKNFVSQINAPGPDNIVAAASADTSGQAAKQASDQAIKQSDPAGYYAHQITLYEGLLDKMASGALPQQDIASSTVSGPVAPIAAPAPAAAQVGG